ncbi:hypothetical protein FOCG_10586 [Fusarium oxysporum f. sp. radicis-lycopersici 26381]|nr:hypothetical protein FOCG_10586 [Fusarium oxysporum f. sp. radicis-lycopersici 26381]
MFELLLKVGADIDGQGWWSNILATALHHAFVDGRAETVRQLIQAGADVEGFVKKFGIRPSKGACRFAGWSTFKAIEYECRFDFAFKSAMSVTEYASVVFKISALEAVAKSLSHRPIHIGNFEVAKLISKWDPGGTFWQDLLGLAALFGDSTTIKALLGDKPDSCST